ncbi:MAG: hypothetical protein RR975_15180, partial [Clostridia bacterium]
SVLGKIMAADTGETITVNAKSYDKLPWSVMQALREKSVSMVITWNGGKKISIPAGYALKDEAGRIYYPLSLLEKLYEKEIVAEKLLTNHLNPTTGGVCITAPSINEVSITSPDQGFTGDTHVIPQVPTEPVKPIISNETSPSTTQNQSASGHNMPLGVVVASILAGIALLASLAVMMYRKRRSNT